MLGTPTRGDMLEMPVFLLCLLVSSAYKPLQIAQIQNERHELNPNCLKLMVSLKEHISKVFFFFGGGGGGGGDQQPMCKYHANFPSKQ